MRNYAKTEELMTRYLLGDLPEAEQIRWEEQFFTDDEAYDQLLALEDELRYDYARGALSPRERKLFERRFLASAQGRRRTEFAQAILDKIAEISATEAAQSAPRNWRRALADFFTPRNPAMRYSLAAAGLLALIGLSWLLIETFRLRGQLKELQARRATQEQESRRQAAEERERNRQLSDELERERQQRAQLEQQLASQRPPASPGATRPRSPLIVLSLALLPGAVRDGNEMKRLIISPDADLVRLQLDLRKTVDHRRYRGFRAALQTDEGAQVPIRELPRLRTTAEGRAVFLRLPARLLAEADYELTLEGLTASGKREGVGDYSFRVVRQ